MKSIKKSMVMILIIMIMSTSVAGCGGTKNTESSDSAGAVEQSGPNISTDGFPITNEKITLKMMGGMASTQGDWNEMLVWKEYEKMTGIHVIFEMVPENTVSEKVNLLLASGDLPDALIRASLTDKDLVVYGSQQKTLIPLKKLMENYAPNFNKLQAELPEIKRNLTAPDGDIYSLPQIQDHLPQRFMLKPWINKKWIDKLGLQMPQSTEDLYNVLKAFKEKDPNENGKPDEIPFGSLGTGVNIHGIDKMLTFFRGFWGIGNRGPKAEFIDMGPDNKVRFIPTDPSYRDLLAFLNRLYSEGLLDNEFMTQQLTQFNAKGAEGLYGFFLASEPLTIPTAKNTDMYTYMPFIKSSDSVDAVYGFFQPITPAIGCYAITKACKHPEAALRWADYFFTEEGTTLGRMGIENVTYVKLPDGSVDYVDSIKNDPNGLHQAVGKFSGFTVGGVPQVNKAKYDKTPNTLPIAIEAANAYLPHKPTELWPIFIPSLDEFNIQNKYGIDIKTYVYEMTVRFIVSAEPLSNWDKYVEEINKRGLKQLLEMYQAQYERWSSY